MRPPSPPLRGLHYASLRASACRRGAHRIRGEPAPYYPRRMRMDSEPWGNASPSCRPAAALPDHAGWGLAAGPRRRALKTSPHGVRSRRRHCRAHAEVERVRVPRRPLGRPAAARGAFSTTLDRPLDYRDGSPGSRVKRVGAERSSRRTLSLDGPAPRLGTAPCRARRPGRRRRAASKIAAAPACWSSLGAVRERYRADRARLCSACASAASSSSRRLQTWAPLHDVERDDRAPSPLPQMASRPEVSASSTLRP